MLIIGEPGMGKSTNITTNYIMVAENFDNDNNVLRIGKKANQYL